MCVQVAVDSLDSFRSLYSSATKARKTAATKLNAKSSRSHSMLTLKLSYKQTTTTTTNAGVKVEQKWVCGKLHLIDLAGK